MMAEIGKRAGVAELFGFRIHGFFCMVALAYVLLG
jgi:hypothetical protein